MVEWFLSKTVPSILLTLPLIITSIVFNFIPIILTIIGSSHSMFFYPYFFAAFVSNLLPATFSPYRVISKLEDHLGLTDKRSKEGSNYLKNRQSYFKPPSNSQQFGQSLSRAVNMAYINMFCLARPIHNPSPILRLSVSAPSNSLPTWPGAPSSS